MSAICHGFVQNAWRKDICSNCFRLRDEHSVKSDLNHRSAPQYNQSQQQHLEHSENNNNNNSSSKMNGQNHSISILVKNGDNNSYKNPSPRYQSPTSGIPRASSHLKYQHSLSGKSYFNGSTFSVDSIRAKAAAAAAANGLNKTNTNSSEVIDISGSKKSVTHPLRGDKSENHLQIVASNGNNNNRLTNNILNGSSAPPALNLVASSSSTVVSVNGKSERSSSTAHFNNNHSSTNANNSSQGSSNRRNNSVSSGPAGGASSCSGSTSSVGAPCANGTVVSVLTNGHTKTLQYPKAVGFASDVNSKKLSVGGVSSSCESSSGKKVAQKSTIMDTTDGDMTNLNKSRTKGILKALNGKNPRRLSVKFPKEVVEFIGYGDDLDASEEEEEEDDDDELSDPQDNASISELLANNSTSPEEKELHQQTIKNTNFNSIKSNLMGFAPIEIGPIVGCTGGKSMENSSKPLVSIETFESRKEPLRITRKSDANGVVDVVPVDSSKKQQATVPSKITSEKTAAIGALFKNSTTAEAKTSGNKQQQPRSANNANDENAVVNKKSSMKVGATNGRQQHDVKFNVTSGNDGVSTIEVNPEKFPITLTTEIPCKTSEEPRNEGERSKPKSILKTTTTPAATATSFPNTNSNDDSTIDSTLINSTARSNGEKSLSNLIILNSGSIASKRTSFLQEIISSEPVTVLTGQTTTENYSSEEPVSLSMERDSLEASMHHLKLGPFKSFEIEDNSSEFDDSLEDSGLDIGKTKAAENSESDDNDNEKFIGSNSSDSGNENDFTERGDTIPKGLYISVDDEVVGKADDEDGLAAQPKLSPDSVLFSSASETSNTGSAESIPECLNVQVIASVVKRQAPAPPPSLPTYKAESLYANENGVDDDEEQQADQCDVYDDVSCYQKPIMIETEACAAAVPTFQPQQEEAEEEEEEEEESIYDDCIAISTNTSNGKFMTGSYDFTNGARTKLDTDSGPDLSDRIPRHVDGIEFIGIRKIDSETHLNNAGLSNGSNKNKQQRSPSPEDVKRERSSSVSPKARRKVNHFFSTIGKRAGAAFGSSHSPLSGAANFMRQKSPSPGPVAIAHEYKRSLSQDEVSMTRTQEIYATLTPASLKFKGLAPVLQKLSRMDNIDGKEESPKEKMFKKHKLLPSIKKLLRMGSKDVYSGTDEVRSYDFKTDLRATNSGGDSSPGASSESSTPNPPSSLEDDIRSRNTNPSPVSMSTPPPQPPSNVQPSQVAPPKPAPPSSRPPPPPPPRVHSLDLMHRVGQQVAMHGPNGTIKPARPPPPVRSNRVAPSFCSVFAAPVPNEDEQQQQPPREVPPSKPRRKASMNTHSTSLVMRSDGEPSLENHVSSLNIETLKLIAGQAPEKIRQNSSQLIRKSSGTPIRWSQFYISDVEPMASGDGFAFYCGRWDDEPCVLLLEEESNNSVVIHLSSCVEICTSFVDIVPAEYVPWNVADYSNGGLDVRASISVLPLCMVTKISSYINSSTYPSMQKKYYALLQALTYWGKADMSDLFVLEGATQLSCQTAPAESELVYVLPIPSRRSFTARSSYQSVPSTDFEILLKQYLLQPCVTSHGDQQVLLRIISGSPSEVEAQVKLFLQVKLYGDRMKPDELDKLRKTRTDRAVLQWLERERALCMKEAIERTLFRESAPISPMRKSFVEFLMIPDTSAKALLELVLDLSK